MVSGTQTGPTRQVLGTAKWAHLFADLGEPGGGAEGLQARDRLQELPGFRVGLPPGLELLLPLGNRLIQTVKRLLKGSPQEAVAFAQGFIPGLPQGFVLGLQTTPGLRRPFLRPLPSHQPGNHGLGRDSMKIADPTAQANARLVEPLVQAILLRGLLRL
jgi:hypothetical protein